MCQRRYKCLHCGAEDVETLPELKSYMHPFLLPLLLPPRYINTIHRLYESVSMLSIVSALPPLHYLPSPTLFQWHRKTNAAPSLFARLLLPPLLQWQTTPYSFFFFFNSFSLQHYVVNLHFLSPIPPTRDPTEHLHPCTPITCVTLLHILRCLPVSESLLMLSCSLRWKLVLPTNPLHAALPLSVHCSLHLWLPPSFSQHHSLGTHFFFSSTQYFMLPFSASPTPRFLLSVPLFPHFSVHLFLSLALIRLREEFTIVYPACEWISKNLFFLICLVHTVGRQLCIFTLSLVNLVRVQSGALERDWSGWCWWWSALEVRPSYEVSEGLDSANPR